MRFCDLEVVQHRERVGVEMFVGVSLRRGGHVGRCVAARGISDAAVPAGEVAHLRFPIGMSGRELMQEDNRRPLAGLLEIEAHIVAAWCVGHPAVLFWPGRRSQLTLVTAMRRKFS